MTWLGEKRKTEFSCTQANHAMSESRIFERIQHFLRYSVVPRVVKNKIEEILLLMADLFGDQWAALSRGHSSSFLTTSEDPSLVWRTFPLPTDIQPFPAEVNLDQTSRGWNVHRKISDLGLYLERKSTHWHWTVSIFFLSSGFIVSVHSTTLILSFKSQQL